MQPARAETVAGAFLNPHHRICRLGSHRAWTRSSGGAELFDRTRRR